MKTHIEPMRLALLVFPVVEERQLYEFYVERILIRGFASLQDKGATVAVV